MKLAYSLNKLSSHKSLVSEEGLSSEDKFPDKYEHAWYNLCLILQFR
jgi:hypothetical protein